MNNSLEPALKRARYVYFPYITTQQLEAPILPKSKGKTANLRYQIERSPKCRMMFGRYAAHMYNYKSNLYVQDINSHFRREVVGIGANYTHRHEP